MFPRLSTVWPLPLSWTSLPSTVPIPPSLWGWGCPPLNGQNCSCHWALYILTSPCLTSSLIGKCLVYSKVHSNITSLGSISYITMQSWVLPPMTCLFYIHYSTWLIDMLDCWFTSSHRLWAFHSFIHFFIPHMFWPIKILGTGDTAVNKTGINPCHYGTI